MLQHADIWFAPVEHGSGGLCEFVGDAMRLTVFRHSVTVQRRGIVYDAIRLVEQLVGDRRIFRIDGVERVAQVIEEFFFGEFCPTRSHKSSHADSHRRMLPARS